MEVGLQGGGEGGRGASEASEPAVLKSEWPSHRSPELGGTLTVWRERPCAKEQSALCPGSALMHAETWGDSVTSQSLSSLICQIGLVKHSLQICLIV